MYLLHTSIKPNLLLQTSQNKYNAKKGKYAEGNNFNNFKYFSSIISLICGQVILLCYFSSSAQTTNFGLFYDQNLFPVRYENLCSNSTKFQNTVPSDGLRMKLGT